MKCSVGACERDAWSRGLCRAHYHRWQRGKPVGGPIAVRQTPEERFWSRVVKHADGCWNWIGSQISTGYGSFYREKKWTLAHRESWRMANGDIPVGLYICHHCDNRLCVRPDHLFPGTATDNMQDCKAKGRTNGAPPPGSRNPSAKLTERDVAAIRSRRASDERAAHLAKEFGVHPETIGVIVARRTWKHVA